MLLLKLWNVHSVSYALELIRTNAATFFHFPLGISCSVCLHCLGSYAWRQKPVEFVMTVFAVAAVWLLTSELCICIGVHSKKFFAKTQMLVYAYLICRDEHGFYNWSRIILPQPKDADVPMRKVLGGLGKFTEYHVTIQGFNEKGPGPFSPMVSATTMEDGKYCKNMHIRAQGWRE